MALPPSHDFRLLKRLVTIPRVLEARGAMSNLRRRGSRLVGPCPVHGGDNPTAFVVNLERNLWFCFTGCGGGGDVVDLVRRLDGVGYREAAHRLATLAGGDDPPSSVVPYSPISASRRRPFNPYTRTLRLDPAVPFLQDKGIRLETASRHEVGAWRGRGFLEGCVGVRLHDPEGRPLGYAGRRLDPADAARNGKWKLPSGLPKARMLYNAHRALPRASRGIVVVEGAWGVLRLAQLSLPAVALLGTQLSGHQQALLGGVQRIVLLLDGDQAGHDAARRLQRRLQPSTDVRRVPLPWGSDPDDLSSDQLEALVLPVLLS